MAKKELVENIVKLYSKLGGNVSDVLGSRSNVTFLGKGSNPEPFVDLDINMEAVGVLGKSKILEELKSPLGYLTANKLNDIQATKLYNNMLKLEEFYYPKQVSNITDMATGTGNLDQKGLASLRARTDKLTDSPLDDLKKIVDDFEPMGVGSQVAKRNKQGVMAFEDLDDIAEPFQSAEETFRKLEAQGQGDLARQLQKLMMEGPLSKVSNKGNLPAKRASAREFLVEALKEDDVLKTNLNSVISVEDVKYITEGGGGIAGDPLRLVEKYFGPRIAEALPAGATGEEIITFTKRVMNNVEDAKGLKPDNPRFNRLTAKFIDEMATGGRAGFRFGKAAGKAFGLSKKLANINKSVDEGVKMGYQDLRKYGLEAEDITRLFKELAMDKTMVGAEKTEYFKMLNQVLKNPDDFPDGIIEIKKRLGLDFADGGRAGFRFGKTAFQGIANMFRRGGDDAVDFAKQEETFRTGPITMDFLETVDPNVTKKFIRTRDTSGPGSYGMYSSLSDMPQGLQAAEFIKNVRVPGKNTIDYEKAEMYIGGGVKLTGKESIDELIQMFLNAVKQPLARGGLAKILEV